MSELFDSAEEDRCWDVVIVGREQIHPRTDMQNSWRSGCQLESYS
jgi:hypothetical protein